MCRSIIVSTFWAVNIDGQTEFVDASTISMLADFVDQNSQSEVCRQSIDGMICLEVAHIVY